MTGNWIERPRGRAAALVVLALLLGAPARGRAAAPPPLLLSVDATDAPRKLFRAEVTIPARPGPLALAYPRWLYHAPTGVVNRIVRLELSAGGQRLEWRRDPVDLFVFHVVVPRGATAVTAVLDVVAPTQPSDGLGAASAQVFVLEWQNVLLYPVDAVTDTLPVRARLRLPGGWGQGCALSAAPAGPDTVAFPEVSMTTLVDSPVVAGRNFTSVALAPPGAPPMILDLAAETPEALAVPPAWTARFVRLAVEARALFGGFPYPTYHFLLALSDELGDDGLEHLRSSDLRLAVRAFTDESYRLAYGYLVPHEYAHAWNGLYRRPVGETGGNYQRPQTGELLWVYEGLTRYLNWVLAARSGLFSVAEARDYAAFLAAKMDHRSGRAWRSLQDTALAAPVLYFAPAAWQSQRREVDFYDESFLIWLEVDATIRRLSGGRRSLDDFCRAFFRPPGDDPRPRPYAFGDVVAALDGVARHDWAALLRSRLDGTGGHAPLDGLALSGWRLVYGDAVGSVQAARDAVNHTVEERFSLGVLVQEDGTLTDVVGGSPAWTAGLGPGMKLLAVDGQPWSPAGLRAAVAGDAAAPVALRVQNGSQTFTTVVDERRGPRYPRLERADGPDLMTEILIPRGD